VISCCVDGPLCGGGYSWVPGSVLTRSGEGTHAIETGAWGRKRTWAVGIVLVVGSILAHRIVADTGQDEKTREGNRHETNVFVREALKDDALLLEDIAAQLLGNNQSAQQDLEEIILQKSRAGDEILFSVDQPSSRVVGTSGRLCPWPFGGRLGCYSNRSRGLRLKKTAKRPVSPEREALRPGTL